MPKPSQSPWPVCAAPVRIAGAAASLAYSQSAADRGAVGSVILRVWVDRFGRASHSTVLKSSHDSELDRSAREAALATKYLPATRTCKPIAGTYLFEADFLGGSVAEPLARPSPPVRR